MGIYCLVSFYSVIIMIVIIFGIFMFVEKRVLDTTHIEKRKSLLSVLQGTPKLFNSTHDQTSLCEIKCGELVGENFMKKSCC